MFVAISVTPCYKFLTVAVYSCIFDIHINCNHPSNTPTFQVFNSQFTISPSPTTATVIDIIIVIISTASGALVVVVF